MNIDQKINERFRELIARVDELMKSRITKSGGVTRYPTGGAIVHESEDHLDEVLVTQWAASCLHLLVSIFGKESDHYRIFKDLASVLTDYSNGTRNVKKAVAIMMAAKEDVEQGYVADSRSLIQAEIFDDLLEQASHFLDTRYHGPAALIAGIVLEEALRRLCLQNNIALRPRAMIGEMNDALAKTGLYNNVVKTRISAIAAIRNQAAHGQWKDFDVKDVEQMIDWVRSFLENSFGDSRLTIQ